MAMKSAAGPVLVGSTDLIHKRPVNSLARKVGELGKALAKSGTHFIDETGRAGAGVANGAAAVADTFANNATKPLALGGTATQPGISAGVTSNGIGMSTGTSTSTGITSRPGNLELPAVVLPFSRGKNNLIDAGSLTNIILGK